LGVKEARKGGERERGMGICFILFEERAKKRPNTGLSVLEDLLVKFNGLLKCFDFATNTLSFLWV
jgi:hypothetical protein